MCKRPCWPTPMEAVRLMDAGYAGRLMLDAFPASGTDDIDGEGKWLATATEILCPSSRGFAGKALDWREFNEVAKARLIASFLRVAPPRKTFPTHRGCTFFYKGLCRLHDTGMKPLEGVLAAHGPKWAGEQGAAVHAAIATLWRSDEGRAAVARWKKEVAAP